MRMRRVTKLMHAKAASPAFANAKEALPQGQTVLQGVFIAKDGVYVQSLDGGAGRLSKLGADGKVTQIPLPFEGTVSAGYANVDRDGMWALIQVLRIRPS